MTFYKNGQSGEGIGQKKYESATKKEKMVIQDLKCESNVNEVIEEIADDGNTDQAAPRGPLPVQTEELSEANLAT